MQYEVEVREVHTVIIVVDALHETEAREKANDILEAGAYPDGTALPEPVYEDTADTDEWAVTRING